MDNKNEIGIPGLVIFCVGLGLLFFVFYLAYHLFQDPTLFAFTETSQAGEGEMMALDFNRFFTNILYVIISFAALAIMGSAAGRIASKGIELFKSRKS